MPPRHPIFPQLHCQMTIQSLTGLPMRHQSELASESTHLVIVQPTSFCNINCQYCYLFDSERRSRSRMSLDTVRAVGRFLSGVKPAGRVLNLSWHAGEPLSVPPEFYESAFKILSETADCPAIAHSLQTNATLVNDRWADLLSRWDVLVGVSLDGPARIHDMSRRDRRGRGTYGRVAAGIEMLQHHKVRMSTISVLTRYAMKFPREILDHIYLLGIRSMAFCPEEADGANSNTVTHDATTADLYSRFVREMLRFCTEHPNVRIREIAQVDQMLRCSPEVSAVSTESTPGAIINIATDGSVSTFSPELLGYPSSKHGPFIWGNVHEDTFATVMQNPNLLAVATEIRRGVNRCRHQCGYYTVCGGGAPSNKLSENGTFDSTATKACELRIKVPTSVMLNHYGM
ncbi:cyclophane-forming radical SAM/SPASM peptide maturase GrrM/OscB [Amycolatopsis thailandensis]|uniref:cyclophane-forming radical SAM/SPASM peptide maturase GrrM/OscB n=1 Tax=Amycolatopsis thailandensis TaxID=589330 RepID=UPI00362C33A4